MSRINSMQELFVLLRLKEEPRFPSELIALPNTPLTRSSVYTQLWRLESKGLVMGFAIPPDSTYNKARTKYRITKSGKAEVQAALTTLGLWG